MSPFFPYRSFQFLIRICSKCGAGGLFFNAFWKRACVQVAGTDIYVIASVHTIHKMQWTGYVMKYEKQNERQFKKKKKRSQMLEKKICTTMTMMSWGLDDVSKRKNRNGKETTKRKLLTITSTLLNINNLILLNIYFHLDRFAFTVVSGVHVYVDFFLLYVVVLIT